MYYLDNAATTWPKPEIVYTTMDETFRNMFSPKRGTNKASRGGGEKLMAARQILADMFNIETPDRIAFTSGCTHALNLAIQAYPWTPGDGIVISAVEHHALSRPARKVVRERGVRLFVVPYTDEVPFDLSVLENFLKNEGPIKMVATTHASNVIGSVLPVEAIGNLARQYGAHYLVDGAQTAGVVPIDVAAACIDMLALPGHKSLYGPPGVGALYISETVPLNTFMEGGTGNDSGLHEMHPTLPDGFEVGTIALPNILAFAAGAHWVNETGLDTIRTHERELLSRMLDGLQALPEVTVYGHTHVDQKTPAVSFNIKGFHPKELGNLLFEEYGIALRAGFHCGPMAHEAIGTIKTGGTLRASMGYFTRQEDVDALLDTLKIVIQQQNPAQLAR